ncbi:MAG TPA: TatD family hydrolase [Acidobacteriota bacterium]|nr:TatD family hydrolase [Acidobacteriota bacterium]
MIDTHAHLDFDAFDADRTAVAKRARDAGIHTIINIGVDFDSCERVIALAEEYPGMYAAVGIHPHDAKTWDGDRAAARLAKLADHPKVVAIGEIGLDYYRNISPPKAQKRAFTEQIAVAQQLKLPIVIHNRDAFADVFEILLKTQAYAVGGVFHCFSGTPSEAQRTIDLGFHISVNGILTFPKATMAEVGRRARLDRILIETDCPFLAPQPYRGKRNEPAYVQLITEKLAEIRGVPIAEIERATDANARDLFNIPMG